MKREAERAALILRPMSRDDVIEAADLERTSFSVPWSEKLLSDCLDSPFDSVWVLELSEEAIEELSPREKNFHLAGYCNLRVIAGEGELMRIAVRPECRGRGYARRMMDRLVESARERGADSITLEVRSSNTAAINLYKAYGFSQEAVRKNYYTAPREDALIMWLHFA